MFDNELPFFDDEPKSHWFRNLVFIAIGAAVAYYVAQYRSKAASNDDLTADGGFRPVASDAQAEPQAAEPEPEPVLDVTAEEFRLTDSEYVLEDELIDDNTEIDLALEEDIENDELDEDEDADTDADVDEAGTSEQDDDYLEGVLAETDDEDQEEQVLEPSPAKEEPPKWVQPDDGNCPPGHPIKARFSTGRYHAPGDRGYEKITPDCCYANIEDAEADGFTRSRWS